jgi:hypothetical protein
MNNFPSGRVARSPCAGAGKAVARSFNIPSDRISIPNPDAAVFPNVAASDSTGSLIQHETAGRSAADDWRIALTKLATWLRI